MGMPNLIHILASWWVKSYWGALLLYSYTSNLFCKNSKVPFNSLVPKAASMLFYPCYCPFHTFLWNPGIHLTSHRFYLILWHCSWVLMKVFGVTIIRQRGRAFGSLQYANDTGFWSRGLLKLCTSSMRSYIRFYESQMFQILGPLQRVYYCSGRNTVLITGVTYHIAGGSLNSSLCPLQCLCKGHLFSNMYTTTDLVLLWKMVTCIFQY